MGCCVPWCKGGNGRAEQTYCCGVYVVLYSMDGCWVSPADADGSTRDTVDASDEWRVGRAERIYVCVLLKYVCPEYSVPGYIHTYSMGYCMEDGI